MTSIALILFNWLRVTLATSIASMDWVKIWKSCCRIYSRPSSLQELLSELKINVLACMVRKPRSISSNDVLLSCPASLWRTCSPRLACVCDPVCGILHQEPDHDHALRGELLHVDQQQGDSVVARYQIIWKPIVVSLDQIQRQSMRCVKKWAPTCPTNLCFLYIICDAEDIYWYMWVGRCQHSTYASCVIHLWQTMNGQRIILNPVNYWQ